MTGGADHLDPAGIGLMVGPGATKRGQEAVVDVDQPAVPHLTQPRWDDLHVSGQHDGVRGVRVDLLADLPEGRFLARIVTRHRNVPKWQAEKAGDRLEI